MVGLWLMPLAPLPPHPLKVLLQWRKSPLIASLQGKVIAREMASNEAEMPPLTPFRVELTDKLAQQEND